MLFDSLCSYFGFLASCSDRLQVAEKAIARCAQDMCAQILNPSPTETAILGGTVHQMFWEKLHKSLLSAESGTQRKPRVIRTVHQMSVKKKKICKSLLSAESAKQRKKTVTRTVHQISGKNTKACSRQSLGHEESEERSGLSIKFHRKTPQKLAHGRIRDMKKAKSNQERPPNFSSLTSYLYVVQCVEELLEKEHPEESPPPPPPFKDCCF